MAGECAGEPWKDEHNGEDGLQQQRRRRTGLRREEVAVVLAAVATAVVLVQRFVEDHGLLLLPGNAAAALQSSMQATTMALAKLQMMFSVANASDNANAGGAGNANSQVKSIPSRYGLEKQSNITTAVQEAEIEAAPVELDPEGSPALLMAQPWFHAISQDGDHGQWRESFRMSRATFFKLLETLGPVLQRQDTNMKDAIPADRKLGAALYRLAHGATFKVVARRFGIGTSSCCKAFYEVCKGLEERLGHLFDFPTAAERLRSVADGFALLGMPNCCGVIGCSNFAVERPMGDMGIEYLDHTRNYSVVMQGVVDSRSRFLDISVGWPGCIPPAAILLKTRFYCRVQESQELLHGPTLDLGTGFPIPQYVLGDQAYPLHPWLITPYADGTSYQIPALFNKTHRHAMGPLRKAFGMLKEQWQLLKTKQRVDNIELLPFIVAASCVLQNFLIDNGEPMPEAEELDEREPAVAVEPPHVYGESVRNALASFVVQCHTGIQ